MPTPFGGFVRNRPNSLLPTSSFLTQDDFGSQLDPYAVINRIRSYNNGLEGRPEPPQERVQSGFGGSQSQQRIRPSFNRLQSARNQDEGYTGRIVSRNNNRRIQARERASQQRSSDQSRSNFNRSLSGAPAQQSQGSQAGYDYGNPTNNQIAGWARQGGWAEKDIPMAIAIVHAESGGRPGAVNNSNRNGSVDTGLFQVNSIHRNGAAAGLNLFDPVQNAKAALNVFRQSGGSWNPWSTYKNNAYAKFMPQVRTTTVPVPQQAVPTVSGLRNSAVNRARAVIGLPYVWGGNSLSQGVDCSGLVQQVYRELGINLPRTAHEQSHFTAMGRRANIGELKQGDLVAWQGGWRGPAYVGHIAIYAGNGRIIEAPSSGLRVRERALRQGENVFGFALNFA